MAILSTDGVARKPVVVELPEGTEAIVIHSVGLAAMSFDHRAVDGAYVARFLARLAEILNELAVRVLADVKIQMKVPLHFTNADQSPGVKLSGGIVSHVMSDLEIRCLPADLPEFIEVDLKTWRWATPYTSRICNSRRAWNRSCTVAKIRLWRWCRFRARWWRTRQPTLPRSRSSSGGSRSSHQQAIRRTGGCGKGRGQGRKETEKSDKK